MALLIDIGNTRIKWARFAGGTLQPQSAAPHADWVVDTFVETVLKRGHRADRVLVSNVAGSSVISAEISGTVTIRNSIIRNAGTICNTAIGKVLTGTNFLSDATCGAGFNPADPKLGPLADNGGATPTHALLAGSPAINAASPCTVGVDQRGLPRSNPCDVGSYEAGITPGGFLFWGVNWDASCPVGLIILAAEYALTIKTIPPLPDKRRAPSALQAR